MHLRSTLAVRRIGVAVTALALGMGMSTPSSGAPAKDKATDCIDYGDVAAAPAGTIPRDDLHVVHKDPLAGALGSARAARTSAKGKPGSGTTAAAFAPVTIPVRFHVIAKDRGQEGGDLSEARIAEQIQVLNEAYAPHGFSFVLEEVTRTYEPQWFNLIYPNGAEPRFRGSSKEIAMKKALYGDSTSETLNIYSASLGQSLLGWATFPSDFDAEATGGNPMPQFRDGVVIDYRSVPSWRATPSGTSRSTAPTARATRRRTRSGTGSSSTTRSRVGAPSRGTTSPTPHPRPRRPSSARSGATRAPAGESTRSRTSWTTPTTPA